MVLVILFLITLSINIMPNNETIILKNNKEVTYEECLNFLLTSKNFDLIIEKEVFNGEFIYRIIINYINEDIRIQTDKCFSFKSAVFSIILDIDKMNLL